MVWTRADYRSTLLDGEEYEVPAAIEFHGNFYDRNYIAVNVPITETKWEGEREPETGETIYLVIRKGQKGALILDHAQPAQPSGSYIKRGHSASWMAPYISIFRQTACTWRRSS